jgi:hypothetical protein
MWAERRPCLRYCAALRRVCVCGERGRGGVLSLSPCFLSCSPALRLLAPLSLSLSAATKAKNSELTSTDVLHSGHASTGPGGGTGAREGRGARGGVGHWRGAGAGAVRCERRRRRTGECGGRDGGASTAREKRRECVGGAVGWRWWWEARTAAATSSEARIARLARAKFTLQRARASI